MERDINAYSFEQEFKISESQQPIKPNLTVNHEDVQFSWGVEEIATPFPRNTLIAAIGLLVIGVVLIILGFVSEVVDVDPTRGIAFWILGSLTTTPGFYYTYQFYKAYKAKTPTERMRILREIPQM
jgi:hypothetical protein